MMYILLAVAFCNNKFSHNCELSAAACCLDSSSGILRATCRARESLLPLRIKLRKYGQAISTCFVNITNQCTFVMIDYSTVPGCSTRMLQHYHPGMFQLCIAPAMGHLPKRYAHVSEHTSTQFKLVLISALYKLRYSLGMAQGRLTSPGKYSQWHVCLIQKHCHLMPQAVANIVTPGVATT